MKLTDEIALLRVTGKQQNKSSAVAEMGDRGHNIDMRRKEGAAVPISRGGECSRKRVQQLKNDVKSHIFWILKKT